MTALVMNCSPVKDGATAATVDIVAECLRPRYEVETACIDDYQIGFCKGCGTCHKTAKCVQRDDVERLMGQFEQADRIVLVSPSYWADVPGQFKAFIDRCTPWSNTHEPHAAIGSGKLGYAVVLRTGPGMAECERIARTIEHFYGHLEVAFCGSLGLCSVEHRDAVGPREAEIRTFCAKI